MNFIFAISTTVGMTVIPLIATEKLGISLFALGMLEGGAELVSTILRLLTGNIFDRTSNKKLLFIAPATLAFISKILLIVPSGLTLLCSKIIERIANGAFAAPRDAFVGIAAKKKGAALALLNVSKTLGCVLGPVLVSTSVYLIGSVKDHTITIILIACGLNLLGLICSLLVTGAGKIEQQKAVMHFNWAEIRSSLKHVNWLFVLVVLFFLGRFNDGLIMIFFKKQGFPEWFYTSTIAFFNTAMLLVSPIIGYWVDKSKYNLILLVTIASLLGFNVIFYNIAGLSWLLAIIGLAAWGLQRAGAQIVFSALIFKSIPHTCYGTMIGIYSIISGVATFGASTLAGYLARYSFHHVFMLSGSFAALALITLLIMSFKSTNSIIPSEKLIP